MTSFRERFTPPWRVEKNECGYVARAKTGEQILAVYAYSDFVVGSSDGWGRLSWAQAHTLAKAICRLADTDTTEGT